MAGGKNKQCLKVHPVCLGAILLAGSLQAWLEAAWAAGYDPGGAAMFGSSVQCSRKWVGTTEAAALLRYFGCRAQLVEFLGELSSFFLSFFRFFLFFFLSFSFFLSSF
jgi:hypothetical protein